MLDFDSGKTISPQRREARKGNLFCFGNADSANRDENLKSLYPIENTLYKYYN